MSATVDEQELLQLNVGDFVAVLTHNMGDGKSHWTLGSVETPPYLRDVEIRLWEKQKDEDYNDGDLPNNEETEQLMNRIAEVKGELQKSIDEADALTEQLRARRASIMQQIGEADEYMAESRAVRDAARDDVESIPDRHWNELKSYRVPPKMVSLVIRAVMLLLSEDEARTWPQMQRILRDFNFKSRITTYDPEQQLSPERREYILQECVSKKSFRYDRAMQGSVAVGPIYYWVLAQLDCGEAQSNKSRVDKEKVARQKELRRVLKQLNEQQARIAEYQALMDDLDDQLRRCREQSLSRSSGGGGTGNSVSRSRLRSLAAARYENSFAGEQQKEYLRPAFYAWRPTDRVIIVLRKNVISNFGGTTKQEQQDGYNMSEPQVRMLDDELLRRQAAAEGEDEDARQRREAEEERQLEDDMFAQNAAEKEARERDDAEILEQRQRAAAEGKPTPAPSPKNDDDEAERTDRLRRTFEGKAWQKVLDRKRDAIVATFTAESAECLDVPEYYVSIQDLTVGSLVVDFDVTHDGKRDARTLQSSVDRFDYPRTKALYEEDDEIDEENEEDEEAEEAAPEHQMKFGGDRWGDIVPDHRQEVLDAFLTDTGNATSLPRNDIVVLDARVEGEEGLTVDYAIKNNELSAEEVQDLVDRFDYPCVWALYQQLAGLDEAGPLHQVRFRGERWETLLAENEDAIAAAFARDTANALEVPEKNVQTEDMRYERGLTVPYTVAGCALSEDDIDVRAEQYKYPETWALYDRLVAEACGAHYQRAFDGEHWETVLSARRPALTDAFRTDSATALEVPVASIEACSLDTDQDRLLVSFNVVDEAVAADKIRDETKTYEYPETWALYGQTVQEQQEGVANLDQTFDGVSWGAMLEEKEPALREAFQRDVSEQLQIPAEAVTVKDMTADDSSMTVHYGVQHDDMLENDVKKGLEDCAYPNTWDLYEELSDDELKARGFGGGSGESGILERRFDGDDWDILVDGCPDELRGAFVNDTAKCLKTSKSNVRVLSAEVGSLVVNYQIIDPEYDDDELARRVEEHDYEELMGLYRRRIRGGDGEEGEAGKKKSRGVDERDDDAAAAAPEGGAEGGIPADAPTVHAMEFEGDNWPEAMKQRGDDVKQAVREDAAEALGVPAEDIEDVDAEATPEGLKASVTVAPQDGQDADKMQEMWDKLDQREFPKTWSVYDEVPRAEIPSDAPTVHAMSFEADHWDTVMEQRGEDVKQAVREDAAAALGIPEEEVEDVDANPTATSLETNVTIAPQDEQDAEKMQEMWDKLDQREFPKTWAIYEEVNGSGDIPADAPTVHAMSFEADNWNEVMEQAGGDVEEAIRRDAASALKVPVEEVEGVEAVPQAESLDTRITLAPQDGQSRDTMQDIWNALDADQFPETWAIYDKVTEENGNHKKRFEGDSWESVVEERRNDLVEAFREDEAACLDAQPEQIDVRSVKADKEGVTIGYNLDKKREDGQEMTREDIAEKTESFDYPKTWSLYDESEYVTTTHQVGFDGDDWKYVVQDKPKELDEAFTTCTAELFDLRVQNVMNARYSLGSLIVDFDLQHPASLTEDEINQKLNDCPYEPVWDLYGGHPYDPKEVVNSTHELGFEGVGWQGVIDTNRAPLEQAFISDTAKALDIEPEDVKVEELAYEEESLIARLDVRHPLLQDDELIQEQLKSYPYDSVWALYQEDPNANFVTTAHQVGFDGEDWKYVVDNKKPALDAAFVTSVSELLDVQEENVTNVRYACENDALLVDFDCKHPITMTEEEANDKLGECGFGRVWDLYGEHPYDPNEVTTTSHEIGFEGDEWSKVQEDQHDALEEAIVADTAEALGVDRDAITDVKTSVADDVLVAKLKVTHHVLQDEELIQEQLSAYPYDRVWALYEDAPFSDEDEKGFGGAGQGESGELERVFEGDDWDILVDGCPDDVRGAFQRDTANALNITPDRVRVLSTEIGSLIVKYKIVDPPADDDELTNRVNDDEFPELTGMYRRRMRGGDGDEGATRSRALPGGEEADTAAAAPLAGAEEEDDGKYKKDFGGEHWHTFVDENRDAIADAFVEDTANALSIPPEDVTVKSVTADENGVRIGYEVPNGDAASDEEAAAHVAEKTDAYDYPAVWALYEELSEYMTSAHDMRFEAEGWEDVVRRRRWELARAIADDSAEAIGIEPDALVDTDMDVTETDLKLTAVFTHKREISMQEIHDKLDAAPFTRTWALYDSMRPSEVMPCHFDGESWAQILEERPDDVKKAFAADTAKAMNVSRLEVEVKDMTADDKGMTVDYVVRGSELDEAAMQQRSEEYAYPETWGLYDGSVGSEKHFDGENWADVARDKREDLEDAFKQDTAEATGVPKDAVEVRQLRATEDGLDVDYLINADKAANAPSRPEVEEKVNAYDYPNTWELYDLTEASKEAANQDRALGFGGDGDRESGELERVFEGDDWDILVDGGCRGDIDDAFQVGAARSLGVPKSNVVVLDAKIGSLHVNYKVRGCPDDDDEIARKIEEEEFPELMDLYKRRIRGGDEGEDGAGKKRGKAALPEGWEETGHQAGFDGEDWAYVAKTKEDEIRDAIKNDVAECLGTQPENVNDIDVNVDKQMLVDFTAQHPEELTSEDVDQRLKACKFESVWDLYGDHPYDPNEKVTTNHSIGFEGEDWRYTVDKKHDAVLKAFKVGTGNALTVPESDVVDVTMDYDKDGIVLNCNVHHSPLQDEQMIQEQLQAYAYDEMWALYEVKPFDPEDNVETVHEIEFEGDAWKLVCELEGDEVRRAIVDDTAAALDVDTSDITDVEYDATDAAITARVKVQHSPLQDTEMISEMLASYEYPNVWALYDHSIESAPMTQTFAGAGWPAISEEKEEEIKDAFTADTAAMLNLDTNHIAVQSVNATEEEGLAVEYTVFGNALSEDEIESRAESYAYPNVWNLYNENATEAVGDADRAADAARGLGGGSGESGILERRFDGDDWDILVDGCPDELRGAFVNDTAKCLKTSKSNVRVLSAEVGSLVVNYQIIDPEYDDDELARRVEEHDYEELMGLYRRRIRGGDGEEGEAGKKKSRGVDERDDDAAAAAPEGGAEGGIPADAPTVHAMEFEGDNWPEAMKQRGDDVKQAVREDAAEALGVPAEDIEDVDAEATPEGLKASVTVAPQDGQDADKMQEMWDKLDQREFPKTWSVYDEVPRAEIPSDAPTVHAMSFEADHWDTVMEQRGDDVKQAVREDAAAALGIPEEEVEDVDANPTATSLETNVTIAPQDEQDAEKMQEMWDKLDQREFPKTWAIYEEVNGSGDIPADAPTVHAMSFEGEEWPRVMEQQEEDVKEAIRNDAAAALGVSPDDIDVVEAETKPDALAANVTVAPQDGQSRETMQGMWDALNDHDFPQTWAIYDAAAAATSDDAAEPVSNARTVALEEDTVVDNHDHGFEGEDWDYVWGLKEDAVKEAFAKEVAAKLNIPREHVADTTFEKSADGMVLTSQIRHPVSMSKEEVDAQLEDHGFPELWSLYEPRPYDPNDKIQTKHIVSFEGEAWDFVMEHREKELKEALRDDTAAALQIPPEDVLSTKPSVDANALEVSIAVAHSPLQDTEVIQEELATYGYDNVWALYCPPDEAPIATRYFEGEHWDAIVDAGAASGNADIREAFAEDTSRAMNNKPEDIEVRDVRTDKDGMTVEYAVQFCLDDPEDVEETSNNYPYPQVWALYKPVSPGEAEAASEPHRKNFPGDNWDPVLEENRQALDDAFKQDTAEALGVQKENVEVSSVYTTPEDGMTVNYRLTGEDADKLPASEVDEKAEAGAYPSVWELYKEDTEAQQEAANQDRALGFGGDGDRESGELERVFEGDDWDILVDGGCRGDIDDAFQVGAARSLGVPKSNVVVLDAKIGSLHVNYKVRGCPDDDDEIARKIEEEEFPELMDLYKRRIRGGDEGEDGAGKTRDAPAEDEVDEEQPEEVDEEQPEEGEKEAEHDEEQPEEVDEEQPEEAEKEAEQDEEQPEEVDEEQPEEEDQAQERAVAAVAPVPAAAAGPHVTKLAVSFDGEDWDYVLERKSQAVAAAFKEETAAALSVTEKDVTITEFVLGSLLVQFKVHHDGAKTDDEMSRMIDAYPYEKVWALYEDRPSGAPATRALNNAATLNRTSTTHEVGFEAPNWEYVERVRHEQILNAFATAAAKACGVEPGDIQGAETAVYPNMMKVTSTILHPVSMSADAVNQAMDAYSFEEVWALYEDGDIGRETKPLTRSFDGDDWAGIVRSAKSAVTEAFRADTSNCLNVPRSAITVKEVRSGSLVVAYTARVPPELSETEVERLTAEYAYPEVWALYKPREGSAPRSAAVAERADGSTAPSQRLFKGVNWDLVVEKQRAELKKAFAEDTAAALGTNESEVDLVSLYTTEGGLVMNYHAEKNGATKAEVEQAVQEAEYAKVWALYRLHADDGYVTTEHGVGFDGEDWDYVLEKNEQTLVDTFVMCTAELLGLQSRHVSNVAANVEPDNSGVALTFTVNHPRSITTSMVDKKLEECRYDPVWQLYETRPYDPSVLVVSAHEIRFEGEGWDFVLEKKRPQVESAFCEDVAEAMHLEPTAVQGVRIEKGETGIVVGCNVTHSPLQDEEMIQEELERHDFSRVWDLYEQRPHAARGDQAVTSHQVGFEGERWAEVMSHRRAKVLNALRVDTAAALQVTPEDVLEVTTEEQVDIMVCSITVQHPHDRTEDMVQEQLSQFDYDRVWALYDDTIAPRVDVLKNRGNSRLTGVMTKRFDGADWDVAVGEYPERIREAFAIDTAEVLQCTPAQVVVDKVDVGSLIVDYRVRDLNLTERAATELTDGYAYPNVWALYKPRGSDVLSARASTTGTRAPPAPIRDNVSARASVNARANQQESKAKRDAEAAKKAAEEAKKKEAEAAAAARQAQQELDAAEEEARRAEDEAQRALERARERRAAAAAAAQAAQAEEERRAQEALEEAQRAVEAAQKADEAAEDARKRNLVPLETGEAEDEQESLEYLRKALSQARRERDEYQDELEQIKTRQRNLDGMQKEVAQMRSTTPTASRAPTKKTKEDEYDEY